MIYVRAVLELLRSDADVRGLAHITGGGLLNLLRLHADVGFEISDPLPVPPVFGLVRELATSPSRRCGRSSTWAAASPSSCRRPTRPPRSSCSPATTRARARIGTITAEPDRITVPPLGIAGGPDGLAL